MEFTKLDALDFSALSEGKEVLLPRQARLKKRIGKFTASECHKLMTVPRKKGEVLSEGAKTYIKQKAVERLISEDYSETQALSTEYIDWGLEHEEEAIEQFSELKGFDVSKTGDEQEFICDGDYFGGTPDGIIVAENSGIEVKCPASHTHLEYLCSISDTSGLLNTKKEYYWQVQAQMSLTDSEYWYFVSYDPRFSDSDLVTHIVKVERVDKSINALKNKIDIAVDYLENLINRIKN